jgi:hypothetical protein
MPNVFVIQETMNDITSAMDYGTLDVLLPPGAQVAFSPAPTVRRLRRKLRTFNDNDFLLLIGDPAAIGIACSIAAEYNNGRFKLLKWSKKENRYFPISVDLHEKGEIDEFV